jgi:hypothetical protein
VDASVTSILPNAPRTEHDFLYMNRAGQGREDDIAAGHQFVKFS